MQSLRIPGIVWLARSRTDDTLDALRRLLKRETLRCALSWVGAFFA